ncbi:hypothetical protein [Streptomyces sp. NPDC058989]|uniref:hypothetical protein n=1 Tax=Streptomyces sp. NPDC058989 TaxID=3346686 RepID=UPI0036C9F475
MYSPFELTDAPTGTTHRMVTPAADIDAPSADPLTSRADGDRPAYVSIVPGPRSPLAGFAATWTVSLAGLRPSSENLWEVTLPTLGDDERSGIHVFVVEAGTPAEALARAGQQALTAESEAHRRGAALFRGPVDVHVWESRGWQDD